mmetsp:Transcript_141929/g.441272  ORF Transcript_141929/g.441272 Transcript_141929/m.441272 type:complete len:429 (-) Transcript_141929:538-1824(-)
MIVGVRILTCCVGLVVAWLSLGTLVYKFTDNCSTDTSCSSSGDLVETQVCGWTLQESFYYSVQAGLSIGFGLLPETRDGSRLYTVFHIILGSSVIGGCLALFVSLAVARHTANQNDLEQQLARHCQKLHVDGYKGFTPEELRELMRTHPRFFHSILEMVEADPAVVKARMSAHLRMPPSQRHKAIDKLILELHEADEQEDGRITIDELKRAMEAEQGFGHRLKRFCSKHSSNIAVWTAFILWMILGVIFGLAAEKWTFIQSLYFAVSTCSTGGLQSVTRTSGGFHVLFAGCYALIGVPLYAAALGTFANLLVDFYNDKVFESKLNARFQASDIEFIDHLNGPGGTGSVNQTEFIELQLLKLGLVDREMLAQFQAQFRNLDTDGSGRVKKHLLLASQPGRAGGGHGGKRGDETLAPEKPAPKEPAEQQV